MGVAELTQEDAESRVAAGIEKLGRSNVKKLDAQSLDIEDFRKCVGGQLAAAKPPVDLFIEVIDCDAAVGVECGFDLAPGEVSGRNYQTLTNAWQSAL